MEKFTFEVNFGVGPVKLIISADTLDEAQAKARTATERMRLAYAGSVLTRGQHSVCHRMLTARPMATSR